MPSIIAQTAPFSDVIQQDVSDAYFNQLQSAGATPPITWTTLVASDAFIVSPNGNIATSALQPGGSYTSSGTMVDGAHNTGSWTFTLTVLTATPSPQTTVIPTTLLSPTGIEVMVPFQINPATGQVGAVQDYSTIISQHVLSVLMTAMSERVMLPSYGVGMQNYVFQPDTPLIEAQIQSTVQSQLKTWEPAAIVQKVSVDSSSAQPNVLTVTLTYSLTPYQATNTVTVSVGGGIPSAPITTIGTFTP